PEVSENCLRWLENGQEIQFESEGQLVSVALQDVVDDDGEIPIRTEPVPYTQLPLREGQEISPDGTLIAYIRADGTHYNLWVVDAALAHYHRIDKSEIPFDRVGWRP
ncbi:MAG: hypothetical protein ABI835_21285, partial [Chloroflexota bacterium]